MSSGTSWTTTASTGAAAISVAGPGRDERVHDGVEAASRSGSEKTSAATALRSRVRQRRRPTAEGLDDAGEARRTRFHDLARHESASIRRAPWPTSRRATSDLPEPIPPVRPTRSMPSTLPCLA